MARHQPIMIPLDPERARIISIGRKERLACKVIHIIQPESPQDNISRENSLGRVFNELHHLQNQHPITIRNPFI